MSEPKLATGERRYPHEAGAEPVISVRGLRVRYGDRQVLDGVDLDIYRGETMVILGASGCGKSTLLRHLEGLEKPAAGSICIDGTDIVTASRTEMERVRRLLGVSFQSAAMFNSMTVGDNVALPLREHTDLAESTIRLITRMKLQQVGLSGVENLYPTELSGGMRKRAALARAMALEPDILFCDEPGAGLDPVTAAEVDRLLLTVNRSLGVTLVVVTHELLSIDRLGGRLLMLAGGEVLFSGPSEEARHSGKPELAEFFHPQ